MSGKAVDHTGSRFGRLVARRYIPGTRTPRASGKWEAICDCGNITYVRTRLLVSGAVSSCGCLARELAAARATTHGMTNTPEFQSWTAMRKRCLYPKHPNYHRYGGRGIRICPRWDSFTAFYEDMGKRLPGMTLDRVDLHGDYTPSNCRWAPLADQSKNREIVHRAIELGTSRTFNPDGSRKERIRPYKPRRR